MGQQTAEATEEYILNPLCVWYTYRRKANLVIEAK